MHFILFDGEQNADSQTCTASNAGKSGDSDGWEGEFFAGIPKIKYEVFL